MGKVYLVGAGPGDFKLITLKGMECIYGADVVIYDNLVNPELLSFARKGAELIYVGKEAAHHEVPQPDINTLLVDKARESNIVVRLKGGDPFIFGRGGEEAEHLAEHGIDFEIVPGVTSAVSVPAYAGIPLTHRDYASTVAFITGHEDEKKKESTIKWHELATGPDTLVFLMGMKNLKLIKDRLLKEGKKGDTPACVITSGTRPEQKVVTATLDKIDAAVKKEGIKPPGIIVVGNVVKLREKLNWYEQKPFFGKKILVTRAAHQSRRFGEMLIDKGARVIYAPTIEVIPIEPNKKLMKAIKAVSKYYAVIFTSVNSVAIFFNTLMECGLDARALKDVKVIPIGQATATLLETKGITADFMPESFTAEGIIDILKGKSLQEKKLLLPRAEEARDVLVEFVAAKGGICDVIPIYKTVPMRKGAALTEKPDVITFTSSSTVKSFLTVYGREVLNDVIIASIGPVTSETLRKNDLPVHIEAARYDIPGLIDAMESYFTGRRKPRNSKHRTRS